MSEKTPADIFGGMSQADIGDWYQKSMLVAYSGLATLRRRSGNQALSPDRASEVISEAFILMDESDVQSFSDTKSFDNHFRRLIFSAVNRLHADTRLDRNPDLMPVEEEVLKNLSVLCKDMLEDAVHDRELHRRFGRTASTFLAGSRLRGPGRRYVERLPVYSAERFDVDNIAEDLGCGRDDVYQYRKRAKRVFGVEDD